MRDGSRNEPPSKPLSPGKRALWEGVAGAAIGGAIAAIWAKCTNQGGKLLHYAFDGALNVGLVAAVIGYIRGAYETSEHALITDNRQLAQQVSELKQDKNFTQQILSEKSDPEKPCCKTRS